MKTTSLSLNGSLIQREPGFVLNIGRRLLRAGKSILATVAILAAVSQVAIASDHVGIYGIINKVVLEPSESAPERVQLWGTFTVAEGSGSTYATPHRGYMYFELPKSKPELAVKEWKDMAAVAGKTEAVGFAQRHKEKGKVRKPDEAPKNPEPYPLGFGLTRVATPPKHHVALQRLFEAAAAGKKST